MNNDINTKTDLNNIKNIQSKIEDKILNIHKKLPKYLMNKGTLENQQNESEATIQPKDFQK